MGYLRPNFPKRVLASDWWRASSEIFGASSEIFGKSSENLRKSVGKARRKKKQGGVGGGRPEKRGRGGWVMTSSKKNKIKEKIKK